ncbi:heparin lyase I family protein [Aquimarina sp. 2201CG14-23]|uniref:heparin lyase I family protein n=1 Tax=Aquimarina mycalae TaxID=3040073 RepID=UPI0024780D8D|nr:heparin lyase I family protein [Aquimarina sp. 2201CG14-23]MDH7448066.1 heparin lyase I family protein [Aquimarina sp. 2201CG14-23]
MKPYITFVILLVNYTFYAQVTLNADGPGDTYELITSVLAPGNKPIEAPGFSINDCDNHSSFDGTHITEAFDKELNDHVFKFFIHLKEDNDRCKKFDRQRNEIKSYDKSPDNLKGVKGETVIYQWKFKIDKKFQVSKKFTHLHQLKAVGGSEKNMPLITLTARKGNPDKLELRYASNLDQTTLATVNLNALRGNWIEAIETVKYGENGVYKIILTNLQTGDELLNYSDNTIRMWKTDADFVRPKWGIYRSLKHPLDLRDEEVLFANFKVTEIQ